MGLDIGPQARVVFSKVVEDALRMLQVPPDSPVLNTEDEKLAIAQSKKTNEKYQSLAPVEHEEELPL